MTSPLPSSPAADWPGATLVDLVRAAMPGGPGTADRDVRALIDDQILLYVESRAERQARAGMRPLQLTRPGGLMHEAAFDIVGRRIPCPPGREDEMLALLASDLRAHVSGTGAVTWPGGRLEILRGEVAVRPVRDFFETRSLEAATA